MELFAKIVYCIHAKHFVLDALQGYEYVSDKTKQILVPCHLFHKKLGLQYLQTFCAFKFIFIVTLLTCCETLLITNSIYVSFMSNWFTHAAEYI